MYRHQMFSLENCIYMHTIPTEVWGHTFSGVNIVNFN